MDQRPNSAGVSLIFFRGRPITLLLLLFGLITGCAAAQKLFNKEGSYYGGNSFPSNGNPTDLEVAHGLKEALNLGIEKTVSQVSQADGFYRDLTIKILFPPEAKRVESHLRQFGLNSLCDDFIRSLNRAAEKGAIEAVSIFSESIGQMTFQDALGILMGPRNAATLYFKEHTLTALSNSFRPVIRESLGKVNATRYWSKITTTYNQVLFVKPIETDLAQYVTSKALEGLFHYVEIEEGKIRDHPFMRTTALLNKVFGFADQN